MLDKLQDLFTNCWEKGTLPQDLRDAVIVSLYKNKGEKSDCSNYRGITLLSIASKILARVFLNWLIPTIAQENTPESQCGFRSNKGTVDMIFVLRQIQQKCSCPRSVWARNPARWQPALWRPARWWHPFFYNRHTIRR